MVSPWVYVGNVDANDSLSGVKVVTVELLGQTVRAEIGAVRRLMVEQRTPPERQKELWMELWQQLPDPEWGEWCMDEAERVDKLLRRAAALRGAPPAAADGHGGKAVAASAERHFVWLGDRLGVKTEHLRDGIEGLARIGMIGTDRMQQEALRRGLGLAVNDDERQTAAPWVVWLGPADMLAHLVDSLWDMGLVTCAGGRQQKWRTATGIFLRADGTRYDLTLKNSRCTNGEKLKLMERAMLGGLRFFVNRG
ncbi:MAG: hypothetical protein IKP21_01885 [Bacteroidales bacterium]|nr:hypothetical protein [Bacteroidales bacterium]